MDIDRILLKSEELEVVFRLPGCYTRSRYDHSGMVEQVHLGENSFLSREIIGGGDGLGGIGLALPFSGDNRWGRRSGRYRAGFLSGMERYGAL